MDKNTHFQVLLSGLAWCNFNFLKRDVELPKKHLIKY
jgi:hypothetical protein